MKAKIVVKVSIDEVKEAAAEFFQNTKVDMSKVDWYSLRNAIKDELQSNRTLLADENPVFAVFEDFGNSIGFDDFGFVDKDDGTTDTSALDWWEDG